MSTSSKNGEAASKVVIVNSNDFCVLKTIKQNKKDKLTTAKRNKAVDNVSFIPKVCSQSGTSPSCSNNHQASTSAKVIHQAIVHSSTSDYLQTGTTSKSSTRKLALKKHVVVRKKDCKPVPKRKPKKSIPKEDVSKVILPIFPRTSETGDKIIVVGETSQNESTFINKNMSKQKGHIFLQKENTVFSESITRPLFMDTTLTLPQVPKTSSDAHKSEEEQSNKGLNNTEEIEKAKRYLETIVILESPKGDYDILSRDELKCLPDKIFVSPARSKMEIDTPKKENITKENSDGLNIKTVSQLENLRIKSDDDLPSKEGLLMIAAHSSNVMRNKEECDVNNMKMGKNFWELEQKDLNFDILIDDRKPGFESEEKIKNIVISDEDAVIFKEMDEFIEDIKQKNMSLTNNGSPVINGIAEGNVAPKYTTEDDKENLDPKNANVAHNGAISRADLLKEFDEIVKQRMSSKHIQTNISLDETEHQFILEIEKIQNEELLTSLGKLPETTFKAVEEKQVTVEESPRRKTEEQGQDEVTSSKKNDILEKLVTETGIKKCDNQIAENATETQLPKLNENKVLKEYVIAKEENVPLVSFAIEKRPDEANKSQEFLNSTNPTLIEEYKEAEAGASHSSTCEQINSSEYQILIIKEDGFLEPLNPVVATSVMDMKSSNEPSPDQSGLNGDKGTCNEETTKEEILALLEEAKSVKFEVTAEGGEIEKLKSFCRTLRDQIRILKQLYGKLETFTESTGKALDRNLRAEEMCALQANLNFMKNVIEKTFKKEEKKLKFKVVSITRKTTDQVKSSTSTKPITKKVYQKTARKPSNKLLRRTLFRMNRLMVALEKNRALLLSARQQAFVSKFKQIAKDDSTDKKTKTVTDTRSISDVEKLNNNICEVVDEDPVIENDANNQMVGSNCANSGKYLDKPDCKNKSLTVILERSESAISSEKENDWLKEIFDLQSTPTDSQEDAQSPVKIQTPSDKVEKKKRGRKPKPKTNQKDHGNGRRFSERLKKSFKPKPLRSGRYFLRSWSSIDTDCNDSTETESCEGEQARQTKIRPTYEVDYSKVLPLYKRDTQFDYDLANDDKPSVVLFRKVLKPESILEETFDDFQNRNIGDFVKGGSQKRRSMNRYETRSRMHEQMVLRNRKM